MASLTAITELERAQHEAKRAYEQLAVQLLPDECRKRGCSVRADYLIRELCDGVAHWDPADPERRYGAYRVADLRALPPAQLGQFVEDLAARAHAPDAPRLGTGAALVDVPLWEPRG